MSPCKIQQHMEGMKVMENASNVLDKKENRSWTHTYWFQPMPVLDEETHNRKNMKYITRCKKPHKKWKLLSEICKVTKKSNVGRQAGDETYIYWFKIKCFNLLLWKK